MATQKESLRIWLYFRIYIISTIVFFIIGSLLFGSLIAIIPATIGIITCMLWYKSVKKCLKEKEVLN
jgi:hypothetical protein